RAGQPVAGAVQVPEVAGAAIDEESAVDERVDEQVELGPAADRAAEGDGTVVEPGDAGGRLALPAGQDLFDDRRGRDAVGAPSARAGERHGAIEQPAFVAGVVAAVVAVAEGGPRVRRSRASAGGRGNGAATRGQKIAAPLHEEEAF